MAIAIDTSGKPGARVNGVTTMTFSYTCTGTNRVLNVAAYTDKTCTGVTYAGVSMTQVGTASTDGAGNSVSAWVLANPASGANNIVVTINTAGIIYMEASSYTGVDQASPVGAVVTNGPTTTTSWTQTLTTTADNSWLVMCAKGRDGSSITAGSNTFIRVAMEVLFTGGFICDSNSAQTPTGSKSMNVTSVSQEFNGIMFELKASTGVAPQTNPSFILNFI